MQDNQLENPPEHAGSAPQGEIREQPAGVLGMFMAVIGVAIALPAIVFVALGVEMGHRGILYAGIVLLIGLLIFSSVALWKVIVSRSTHFRDSEIR